MSFQGARGAIFLFFCLLGRFEDFFIVILQCIRFFVQSPGIQTETELQDLIDRKRQALRDDDECEMDYVYPRQTIAIESEKRMKLIDCFSILALWSSSPF